MKILIATDGSEYSQEAVKKSTDLISPGELTEFRIISVIEPFAPVGVEPFGVSSNYYAEAEKEAEKSAHDVVDAAKEMLIAELNGSDVNVETDVFFSRSTKGAIVEDAQKWDADLIVVGSHGYGFFKRMLLGSVSDAVVRYAPCSVLVIRKDDH